MCGGEQEFLNSYQVSKKLGLGSRMQRHNMRKVQPFTLSFQDFITIFSQNEITYLRTCMHNLLLRP